MSYQLKEINDAIKKDPKAFLAACDLGFENRVKAAADAVIDNLDQSPIVLLSGPSGSGKTTTAMKVEAELRKRGVLTHTVSMDNYFRTVSQEDAPRTETGEVDFESPHYMDMDLLLAHFQALERGEEVRVPKFDFTRQKRDESLSYPLGLGPREVAIFEGIHALNDEVYGRHPHATGIYISARSDILEGAEMRFKGPWMRLTRRAMRDYQFRGTGVVETLRMWKNVRRGEALYIDPYKDRATITIDSSIPYEVSVMRNFAKPLLDAAYGAVPSDHPKREDLAMLIRAFEYFEPVAPSLLHPDSLIREFIGGGSYEYK